MLHAWLATPSPGSMQITVSCGVSLGKIGSSEEEVGEASDGVKLKLGRCNGILEKLTIIYYFDDHRNQIFEAGNSGSSSPTKYC